MAKKTEYDLYFKNKLEDFQKQLKKELKPRIDEAADREFVAGKILEEINSRKQNLTHGIMGDVEQPDFYKLALIEGFEDCLKIFRNKPVDRFMTEKLPKIKKEHLDKIKEGYVHGYQLDPGFIQIRGHKTILDFMATFYACEETASWVRKVLEGPEDIPHTGMEREISGPTGNRQKVRINPERTFTSIFKEPEMISPLLDFLQENNITDATGKWMGISKGKTDLMGFVDALKIKSLINFTTDTEIGKIFKEKFSVAISERSMTSDTFVRKDARAEYLSFIDDFLLEYQQGKTGR